jgi:hypothetical protein
MDNLSDLLAHKGLSEPPEINIIKEYISKKYDEKVSVKVDPTKITIFANSSALAGNLRMNIPEIQEACGSNKRIVIYLE